jgi:hypothetical protein
MGHGLLSAAAQAATALAGNGGAWNASARAAALAGLERTGLPGSKDEDWRFTPITSLDRAWNPAPRSTVENVEHGLEGLDAVEILLVDGWLAPVPDLPDGVSLVRGGADVEFPGEEFDKARAFEALNLASAPEPFVLQVDGVVERPITSCMPRPTPASRRSPAPASGSRWAAARNSLWWKTMWVRAAIS